jgi:hypothetical protein
MSATLEVIKLIPSEIKIKGQRFVPLRDRFIRDTETIATTDRTKDFFLTKQGKQPSQANFDKEGQLVPEVNAALILGLRAYVRDRTLTRAEWLTFFTTSSYRMRIKTPDEVMVAEETLADIAFGTPLPDRLIIAPSADEAFNPARSLLDMRFFLVGTDKIVKGSNFLFTVDWKEGANGLTASAQLVIELYVVEFEPAK